MFRETQINGVNTSNLVINNVQILKSRYRVENHI
jgi:hypothetical protein